MHSVNMTNAIVSAYKANTLLFLIIQYFTIIFTRLLKTYFYLDVCGLKNKKLNYC